MNYFDREEDDIRRRFLQDIWIIKYFISFIASLYFNLYLKIYINRSIGIQSLNNKGDKRPFLISIRSDLLFRITLIIWHLYKLWIALYPQALSTL